MSFSPGAEFVPFPSASVGFKSFWMRYKNLNSLSNYEHFALSEFFQLAILVFAFLTMESHVVVNSCEVQQIFAYVLESSDFLFF